MDAITTANADTTKTPTPNTIAQPPNQLHDERYHRQANPTIYPDTIFTQPPTSTPSSQTPNQKEYLPKLKHYQLSTCSLPTNDAIKERNNNREVK